MRSTRTRIILFTLGVALGAVLFLWFRKSSSAPRPMAMPKVAVAREEKAAVPPPPPGPFREATQPVSDDERAERNEARPEAGSGETQLDHLLKSVVQANAGELKLTPAEIE